MQILLTFLQIKLQLINQLRTVFFLVPKNIYSVPKNNYFSTEIIEYIKKL